jgi:hypothetical protein
MAKEKDLLEAGEAAGYSALALRRVKERLEALSSELAPGTKWSRWWWLPSAGYSKEDAKAAGITSDAKWPYGPNIDLWSRTRLVNWAKRHGLKVARQGAPLCLNWLEKGQCRGCDIRGQGHDEFRLDHMSGWTLNGLPAVIVNHPYSLSDRDFSLLATTGEQHPGLRMSMPGVSWYGNATIQVEVWNRAAQDKAET